MVCLQKEPMTPETAACGRTGTDSCGLLSWWQDQLLWCVDCCVPGGCVLVLRHCSVPALACIVPTVLSVNIGWRYVALLLVRLVVPGWVPVTRV